MLPAFKIGPDAAVQHSPDDAPARGAVTDGEPAARNGVAHHAPAGPAQFR
jgi:hypothetical protein